MKTKLKNKIIPDLIYGATIFVYAGMGLTEMIRNFNKQAKESLRPDNFNYNPLCVYHFFNGNFDEKLWSHVILYSEKQNVEMSQLVHEITHIKNVVFATRNVRSELERDEHEACYLEFLFREISK
ncbi:hypothetical protein ND864_17325 [Leptospira levettii]|uniref:hypothetical protein n=1 Tax=Leptospira levettii TaxID=2023178 RepID=UPI00223E08A9|nr:hypothetical protein [Leptospira levettii]MCW7467484.1 hypothetical protein [Leptospira levettii]